MLYACKLGPIRTMQGSFVAFFGFTEAGIVSPVIGKIADKEGLAGLLQHVYGERDLCCESNLAKAGRRLGFKSAPIPEWVASARAGLAFGLSLGDLGGEAGIPAVVDGFILAASVGVRVGLNVRAAGRGSAAGENVVRLTRRSRPARANSAALCHQ
jgi:hypothetical protein